MRLSIWEFALCGFRQQADPVAKAVVGLEVLVMEVQVVEMGVLVVGRVGATGHFFRGKDFLVYKFCSVIL